MNLISRRKLDAFKDFNPKKATRKQIKEFSENCGLLGLDLCRMAIKNWEKRTLKKWEYE